MRDLSRLFNPGSIAVIGGGAWCESVIAAADRIGYRGEIVPVHPSRNHVANRAAIRNLEERDKPVDAAFLGINRHATVELVRSLRDLGTGGAVCFASGFTESAAEDATGPDLQSELLKSARDMPLLGPNCYGFVNALDGASIWPDQHGMSPVESGVAILTQSSNIAINLTMQRRALPLAYMITCGNMAQTSQAEIALSLLDDPRVTAIGLHVEGFCDLREWEALAARAVERQVPLVVLKVGKTEQARHATISHTASVAGSDAGAQAFLDRLGIARVPDLPTFLECLKLLHVAGSLPSRKISCISCSGGEASLMADLAKQEDLEFSPLTDTQKSGLRTVLGPKVALANPLDYHTYIWRDAKAMAQTWAHMAGSDTALTFSVVDYPHTDRTDWECATRAALMARKKSNAPFAVVSSLPELMPQEVADQLMQGGVIPMMGMREALCAAAAAASCGPARSTLPVLVPPEITETSILDEAQSKSELAQFGLPVPRSRKGVSPHEIAEHARSLKPPLALKGAGIAHKSEHGAVCIGLAADEIFARARAMNTPGYLVEEMVQGGVAELLIGVVRDPAHGFVLGIGAGGVLAELLSDVVSVLLPATRNEIEEGLQRLKCAPLLRGYRGKTGADTRAVVAAVMAVQRYVLANAQTVAEVEVNPLICLPDGAVAVDALIRKAKA